MFVGLLKTNQDETAILYDTFSEAINGLHKQMNNSLYLIQAAEILETYSIGNNLLSNSESFKLVASLRTVK